MNGIPIIFALLVVEMGARVYGNLSNDIADGLKQTNKTILSRKRRYLVFPEGSSFQVVFCLTYPSVAIQGQVFTNGNTAAMAWELPSTPIFLDEKFKKDDDDDEKAETTTTMEPDHSEDSHDRSWMVPLSWTYPQKPQYQTGWGNDRASNPFEGYYHQHSLPSVSNGNFGNHRFYNQNPFEFWERKRFKRVSVPETPSCNSNRTKRSVANHIQRRSRRELFTKIEKLLTALSRDGKACVLKAICQVNKLPSGKGTFWEEIIKAIFKTKHDPHPDEDIYDGAANLSHDCDNQYPDCNGHVLSNLFKNKVNKDL